MAVDHGVVAQVAVIIRSEQAAGNAGFADSRALMGTAFARDGLTSADDRSSADGIVFVLAAPGDPRYRIMQQNLEQGYYLAYDGAVRVPINPEILAWYQALKSTLLSPPVLPAAVASGIRWV